MSFEEQGSPTVDNYASKFSRQMGLGFCVYYTSNLVRSTYSFENWGISIRYSPVLAGAYSVT